MIKRLIGIILIMALTVTSLYASPLFGDLPSKHWARDAVAQLAAKGLIEGYPDGTFKGDRSATRWEIAMVIARFLAKSEQMWATFASKEEAESLKRLLLEYKDELNSLGVRTTELEKGYSKLESRVRDLEHIRFYGTFDAIYAGQQFGGDLATAGQANAFTVNDWSNGRPLINGKAVSSLVKLGLVSAVPGFDLGVEFAGYYAQGEPGVDFYWGVTPPYLSNPFTAASGGINANVANMNYPYSKLTLDNLWLQHRATKTRVIIGSFNPTQIDTFVLLGQRNPCLNPPSVLPFYGANATGSFKLIAENPFYYEIMYSRMPSASNAAAPTVNYYLTNLGAASLGYNFNLFENISAKLVLNAMKVINERNTNGVVQNASLITIPVRADPAGVGRSQGWQGFLNVGPQTGGTWGASLTLDFPKNFTLISEYANSRYRANTTGSTFTSGIGGSLGRVALEYKPAKWVFGLDYISVSPTFDCMLLPYPQSNNIPVFLPYSTYYSNYYQLHDNIKYPNNRSGYRFNAAYSFKQGKVAVNLGSLDQRLSSRPTNISSIGFIEPFFPELRNGGDERGRLQDAGINISYNWPKNKLKTDVGYYNYLLMRSAPDVDSMDLIEKVAMLGLTYPFNEKFTAYGNWVFISYHGQFVDQTAQNFKQSIPAVAASYQLNPQALVMASYKIYNFYNYAVANSDWNGRQTTLEVKINF